MGEQVGQEVLARVDLLIRQGSDVPWALTYAEDDGTGPVAQSFAGWTVRSQIRRKVGGDIWHTMTDTDGITLTEDGTTLTLTGLIGHAVTEDPAWDARASRNGTDGLLPAGVWDVELVKADGTVIPLAEGSVFVDPDVTRGL